MIIRIAIVGEVLFLYKSNQISKNIDLSQPIKKNISEYEHIINKSLNISDLNFPKNVIIKVLLVQFEKLLINPYLDLTLI